MISADSHVTTLPDGWKPYVPSTYHERLPRLTRLPDGSDAVWFEGKVDSFRLSAELRGSLDKRVGRRSGFIRLEEVRPGALDPGARPADQDLDGITAEVLYGGGPPAASDDLAFQVALFRAYNDWLADYCKAAPDRLFGVGYVPVYDLGMAVAEMRRIKGLGHVAALLPTYHAHAPYSEAFWDPIWAEAQDLDLPVVFHARTTMHGTPIGGNLIDMDTRGGRLAYGNVGACAQFILACQLLWSGTYERFPRLRVGHIENNTGWIAYMLERADRLYGKQAKDGPHDLEMAPSAYFRRNVFATFIEDTVGIKMRQEIGVGNILFGSDYPHGDTSFPKSAATLSEHTAGIPDSDARAIFRDNAIAWYRLPLPRASAGDEARRPSGATP
jgi:predicted TIM-barrel fold metal-dependent hydrolase